MEDGRDRSTLRDRRAEVTRQAILDAARVMFRDEGFNGTSIRELAEHAGVAVQTIYSTFGSKVGVAEALNDQLEAEADVRALAVQGLSSSDPREVLRLLARMQRQIWERCGDIIMIGRQSALGGDEGKALWDKGQRAHREGLARFAQHLAELGALRPGLSAERAGVELVALANVDTYAAFTETGGLSFDDLEEWLAGALTTVLDPRSGAPAGRRPKGRS